MRKLRQNKLLFFILYFKVYIIFNQFKNAITLIMVATAVFSLMVDEVIDAVAIVLIILVIMFTNLFVYD